MRKKSAARTFLEEVVFTYEGDECLVWPYGKNSAGYGSLPDGLVTRMACEIENGPPPTDKHQAAHTCGKGHEGCCARKHLVWKTHKENHADRKLHGTNLPGNTRLTEREIEYAKQMKGKMTQQKIADELKVSRGHVGLILQGKRWPNK